MKAVVIALALLAGLSAAWAGSITLLGVGSAGGGGGCSNSLIFSSACNSQYLGVTGL